MFVSPFTILHLAYYYTCSIVTHALMGAGYHCIVSPDPGRTCKALRAHIATDAFDTTMFHVREGVVEIGRSARV